jgi:predicted transcriptional regulator
LSKPRLPADTVAKNRVLAFLLVSIGTAEDAVAERLKVTKRTVRSYVKHETARRLRLAQADPLLDRAEAEAQYDWAMQQVVAALPQAGPRDKAPLLGQFIAARNAKNKVRGTEAPVRTENKSIHIAVRYDQLSASRLKELREEIAAEARALNPAPLALQGERDA